MKSKRTENQWHFSEIAERIRPSMIREILKMTMRPDIISFAGGLPSPATFPIHEMRVAFDRVLSRFGNVALQYGPTDGYLPLRAWIADYLSDPGCKITPEQVLMVSGSQQGLDLVGKILINPEDRVLVETPSYLGALQAFSLYGAKFDSIPSDGEGLIPSAVGKVAPGARLLYALPNFQNPTGRSLSTGRRMELMEECARADLPIVEDDPYGALSYNGSFRPRLLNLNPARVIYMGSFSKVLTPGIRLGYVVAPVSLIKKLEQAKQAADLHTSQLSQMVVYEAIKDGFLNSHIANIRGLYADQCSSMVSALSECMPNGVTWTVPEGGMFIWLTLPVGLDASLLFSKAIEQKVAFVPGTPFYAGTPQSNTLRLSFVTVPKEKIRSGIATLASVINQALCELMMPSTRKIFCPKNESLY